MQAAQVIQPLALNGPVLAGLAPGLPLDLIAPTGNPAEIRVSPGIPRGADGDLRPGDLKGIVRDIADQPIAGGYYR